MIRTTFYKLEAAWLSIQFLDFLLTRFLNWIVIYKK